MSHWWNVPRRTYQSIPLVELSQNILFFFANLENKKSYEGLKFNGTVLFHFMRPMNVYASKRFLWVQSIFMSPMKLLCVQSTFMSPMKVLCVQSILSTQKEEITRFLHSDGWAAFGGINAMQQQFTHQWFNHQLHFVHPDNPQVHTQSIEATWRALKNGLRHLHGSSPELLPTYIFQHIFRRAHGNKKIFQHILEEIRINYPV